MKTKLFISLAACVVASVLMSSCSNEESTAANGQLTAFTGGIVTEAPMERVQICTSEISTVVPGFITRTSMDRGVIGGEGSFLWGPKDVIYVEDDNNKLFKSQNTINDAVERTTFSVGGSYIAKSQYDVYYCGTNSGADEKKVVIAKDQTQVAFNNTKHFGAVGDCGVAKAKKTTAQGKSGYSFDLEHKASYLCFLPYIDFKVQRASFKIQRIEITSDNNIAGTYELTQSGLSATGTNESKTITLHVGTDGLLLANQTAKASNIDNSLYVVIAPGTHTLKVKYTVLDAKGKAMTITKSYKSHHFAANKICDIPVYLGAIPLYNGHNYYMWDARENYWSGHEWDASDAWQPTKNTVGNDDYPKSKEADGARWYNDVEGPLEASVNPLFKQLPNANELAWYVLKGDCYWDNSSLWKAFDKVHSGGIWLKKLSVIAEENGKKPAELKQNDPNGKNLLTFSNPQSYKFPPKFGKPSDSEIGKYFFLPAMGHYTQGDTYHFGFGGSYWSSTADPSYNRGAYCLNFFYGAVELYYEPRTRGCIAQPFESPSPIVLF